MREEESNKFFSSVQAAQFLGITIDRLRVLAQRGDIPSEQWGSTRGPRLYDIEDLQEWKKKKR